MSKTKTKQQVRIKREWVWIDLEMTGLNPSHDTIIEIATLVTNSSLQIVSEGPDLVIHQTDNRLLKMDEWNLTHHTDSGLLQDVRESTTTMKDAETQTLEFIKKYAKEKECVLCGSSVYHDKNFIKKHMPLLHDFFHFRVIDVASIIEIAKRWYPEVKPYKYNAKHRAMDDIKESVAALQYYRELIFI